MFSARTAWPRETNRLTLAQGAAQLGATRMLDLTVSNPTSVDLTYDTEAITRALSDPGGLTYEPAPFGPMRAREAVAEYYRRRGIAVLPEDVFLVATTSEAYTFLFRLLVNPGEGVAIPRPSYPLFNYLADLSDVALEPYHLRCVDDRWRLDASSLHEAIDETTRAIITVNPNNPTGSCLRPEEKALLVECAEKNDLAIISDEVFLDALNDPREAARASFIGTSSALTFTLSGLSKVAGLPQMKVSWIVVSGPRRLTDEARARLEIIADTYLSLSTPAARALPDLLHGAEAFQDRLRARLRENRESLAALTRGSPVVPRATEGGWSAMMDLPEEQDDEAWAIELIEKANVLVHPGYLFDVEEPSAIVVSALLRPDVFREGIERLVEAVRAHVERRGA